MAFVLKNSIFFHISKTAGRATRNYIKSIHENSNDLLMSKDTGRSDGDPPFHLIKNKPDIWKNKDVKFTTIRHPASWYISKYIHMYNNKGRWGKYYNNPKNPFFYDDNYSFKKMRFWGNNQNKTFNNFINYVLEHQIPLLGDEFRKLSEGDFNWDYIMKQENLPEDIIRVMDLAGEPIIKEKKMNKKGVNSKNQKNSCIYSKKQYNKLLKLEDEIMEIGEYNETPPNNIKIK